jgi:hypothetical protein
MWLSIFIKEEIWPGTGPRVHMDNHHPEAWLLSLAHGLAELIWSQFLSPTALKQKAVWHVTAWPYGYLSLNFLPLVNHTDA